MIAQRFRTGFIILRMISIVVFCPLPDRVFPLAENLVAGGLVVLQSVTALADLGVAVQQRQPDVLVCGLVQPDDAFFDVTRMLAASAPCAVLVLAGSLDASSLAASVTAGVHAYLPGHVAHGFSAQQLLAFVQVAQARFKHEAALTQALHEARNQLDERKVVDHAKTILMRARHLSDDDAFRMMRTASMHSNQRLAEVSGHIIHAARFAEGVNRAGQLRMLSQRLVKLQALQLLRSDQASAATLQDSIGRINNNLKVLAQNFSQPELAALVKEAEATWGELKRKLKRKPHVQDMGVIDSLAEALLAQAEHLTDQLESAGAARPLQVLNLAGRQRMLSQRFAKFALLRALNQQSKADDAGSANAMLQARQSFDKAQHYLNNIPLSTPEIGRLLANAKLDWTRLLAGVEQINLVAGQTQVESASEALLTVFEQLSATYESSMQMLMG